MILNLLMTMAESSSLDLNFVISNFCSLADKYSDNIFRICLLQLKNVHDAEDATQNVFIKLLENQKGFNNQEHMKAWLIRVAINECRNMQKKLKTIKNLDLTEFCMYANDDDKELFDAVLQLDPKLKSAIYLHYYEGYSIAEIAGILKRSESAVKTHLFRGREALRKQLKGEVDFES